MRRLDPRHLILLGFLFVLCGLLLSTDAMPSYAQGGQPEADYEGADECASCHRDLSRVHTDTAHARALIDVSKNKDAIKADFAAGEPERTVTIPGETAARPFTKDDIAFVIGAGRYVERYVYQIERGKFAIFPAEWNVEKKQWQPYPKTGTWPTDAAFDFVANCAGCHTTDLNVNRGRWRDDGVQCEACHGPGSIHVELAKDAGSEPEGDALKAVRASISLSPDAQICGQCHSQGTNKASGLPYSVDYRPGNPLLDVFTLVKEDDPIHWWARGHAKSPNMQYNEWVLSGHANSLDSLKGKEGVEGACLSCHSADYTFTNTLIEKVRAGTRRGDPPAVLTLDTAQFGVTCTSCHNPHLAANADAPQTPFNLVADSYTLCTSCHRDTEATTGQHHPVKEMFEGIQVVQEVQAEASQHFTDQNGPRCVSCHMERVPIDGATRASHAAKPLLPGDTINLEGVKDSCTSCHTDIAPDALQKFVTDAQAETSERLKAIRAALKSDSPAWVVTAIEFVEGDGSLGIHNHRYTTALLTAVETQLGLFTLPQTGAPSERPVLNSAECAECHQKEHATWLESPHARSSLNVRFRAEYAKLGQPSYCMGCHASGYDSATQKYVFEGVVCSTCHYTDNNAKHPPAPFKIANQSASCGACHSGAHAPTYDEWLISAHNEAKIDCVDCHTPHNNGLKQGDINTTCGNCHKSALQDQVHMGVNQATGKEMTCVDCHMTRVRDEAGVFMLKTGHSMAVEPDTCGNCHGGLHEMKKSVVDGTGAPHATEGEPSVTELQAEVTRLRDNAQTNWATGIAGGAIGMLLVIGIGALILRRGRLL